MIRIMSLVPTMKQHVAVSAEAEEEKTDQAEDKEKLEGEDGDYDLDKLAKSTQSRFTSE